MSDPRTEPSPALPPVEPSSGGLAGSVSKGPDAASDEMLLAGIRRSDEPALLGLYDRYGGLVYTLALRIGGDRDLAEEVTHDVFLRCWHGLEAYDAARGAPAGWLLAIARGRALEAARGRQSGGRPGQDEPSAEAGMPATRGPTQSNASQRADNVAPREMVERALAELAGPQRAAIELAYYDGLTQSEVAGQLAEPPGVVKARIRDGVRRLRRLLAPIVDDSAQREDGAP
jgi:RNA polymerase sigma-70 factor (ECF subfamily)